MPEYQQREMFRGASFVFDVQVKRRPIAAPLESDPVPVDITGWKMWFTAKYYLSDPDLRAVTQQTEAGGGIVYTLPLIGMAEVTVPPLATRGFPDGPVALHYDVQVMDLIGNVFVVEAGTLTVYPHATSAIA